MWRCPYLHAKNLKYTNINLLKYCKEQDLEIVAVNLKLFCKNVIILCIYRSPGGNLVYFLDQLDSILNSLENLKTEFIICGDFNINYIRVNNKKTQLENLLNMYNLIGTVYFPTRITTTSCSAIDNIFVDKRRKYTIKPHINGLSDHDAQLLTLNDLVQPIRDSKHGYIRNINKLTIAEFQSLLSEELWEDILKIQMLILCLNIF